MRGCGAQTPKRLSQDFNKFIKKLDKIVKSKKFSRYFLQTFSKQKNNHECFILVGVWGEDPGS